MPSGRTQIAVSSSTPNPSSLEAYVVASQDAPIVWIWQRRPDRDQAFPPEPVEISGPNAVVTVDRLGLTLPLAELYRGIGHQ